MGRLDSNVRSVGSEARFQQPSPSSGSRRSGQTQSTPSSSLNAGSEVFHAGTRAHGNVVAQCRPLSLLQSAAYCMYVLLHCEPGAPNRRKRQCYVPSKSNNFHASPENGPSRAGPLKSHFSSIFQHPSPPSRRSRQLSSATSPSSYTDLELSQAGIRAHERGDA